MKMNYFLKVNINRERNRKKNEYYDNGLLFFEGNYFKGKKSGKGKEFRKNGNLLFEGEYLNGLKHGKGNEYYENGRILFEGEYFKGEDMEKVKNIMIKKNH